MQQTNFIQIDGWVTLDSTGYVYFHNSEPHSSTTRYKRTYLDGRTEHATGDTHWYSGDKMYAIEYPHDEHRDYPGLTIETPIRVTLQIVPPCVQNS